MSKATRKAAVAALITAGAIALGGATGGASSIEARRDSKPPPWCGVICMRSEAIGDAGTERQGRMLAFNMTGNPPPR
jgi:hypothetical protein